MLHPRCKWVCVSGCRNSCASGRTERRGGVDAAEWRERRGVRNGSVGGTRKGSSVCKYRIGGRFCGAERVIRACNGQAESRSGKRRRAHARRVKLLRAGGDEWTADRGSRRTERYSVRVLRAEDIRSRYGRSEGGIARLWIQIKSRRRGDGGCTETWRCHGRTEGRSRGDGSRAESRRRGGRGCAKDTVRGNRGSAERLTATEYRVAGGIVGVVGRHPCENWRSAERGYLRFRLLCKDPAAVEGTGRRCGRDAEDRVRLQSSGRAAEQAGRGGCCSTEQRSIRLRSYRRVKQRSGGRVTELGRPAKHIAILPEYILRRSAEDRIILRRSKRWCVILHAAVRRRCARRSKKGAGTARRSTKSAEIVSEGRCSAKHGRCSAIGLSEYRRRVS